MYRTLHCKSDYLICVLCDIWLHYWSVMRVLYMLHVLLVILFDHCALQHVNKCKSWHPHTQYTIVERCDCVHGILCTLGGKLHSRRCRGCHFLPQGCTKPMDPHHSLQYTIAVTSPWRFVHSRWKMAPEAKPRVPFFCEGVQNPWTQVTAFNNCFVIPLYNCYSSCFSKFCCQL